MRAGSKFAGRLIIAAVSLSILLVWVSPGAAIKVVRQESAVVDSPKKAAVAEKDKRAEDTARVSTRSLLNDVESQRKSGSTTDSLDTWIDRDGDGVNDRLRKTPVRDKTPVRSRPAQQETVKPQTRDKDRTKSRQTPPQKSIKKQERKTPPAKKSTKTTDEEPKKKRRR